MAPPREWMKRRGNDNRSDAVRERPPRKRQRPGRKDTRKRPGRKRPGRKRPGTKDTRLLPYCLCKGCPNRMQTAKWCQGFCKKHASDPRREKEEERERRKRRTSGEERKRRTSGGCDVMCQQDHEAEEKKLMTPQRKRRTSGGCDVRCQQDDEEMEKKLMTPQAPENKKRQATMSELLTILKKKNKLPLPKMEIERCPEILKKKNEQPPQKMEIQRCPGYDEHTQLDGQLAHSWHIREGRHNVIRPAISEEGAGLICMPPSPQPLPCQWYRKSKVVGDSEVFYWTNDLDGVEVLDISGGAAHKNDLVHMSY